MLAVGTDRVRGLHRSPAGGLFDAVRRARERLPYPSTGTGTRFEIVSSRVAGMVRKARTNANMELETRIGKVLNLGFEDCVTDLS